MSKFILRLDDACEKRDVEKWNIMEKLLDRYGIKPLVGIIPHCEDPMMEQYHEDPDFWKRVKIWQSKGWSIALHGYNHVYSTQCGGINPIHQRSEFAGEPLDIQREKIRNGVAIFREHGIEPEIFFAPSHTFDENTLQALRVESNIRIISDTVATKPYKESGFVFVPQQSGKARKLPFAVTTLCYHPNQMRQAGFDGLEAFLRKNHSQFVSFPQEATSRSKSALDKVLGKLYFLIKRIR